MADYKTFAFISLALGFELDVLGTVQSGTGRGADSVIICALAFYIVAFLLAVFIYFGDLKGNLTATIICMVFTILAGLYTKYFLLLFIVSSSTSFFFSPSPPSPLPPPSPPPHFSPLPPFPLPLLIPLPHPPPHSFDSSSHSFFSFLPLYFSL